MGNITVAYFLLTNSVYCHERSLKVTTSCKFYAQNAP